VRGGVGVGKIEVWKNFQNSLMFFVGGLRWAGVFFFGLGSV